MTARCKEPFAGIAAVEALAAAAGLAALLLAAFAPSLLNPFLLDDRVLIVQNARIRGFRYLLDLLTSPFFPVEDAGQGAYFRPLANISFLLDYQVWQLRPLGYHLTNVLLHGVNAWLVFRLLKKIPGLGTACAWLAAAVFCVHPLQTSAVYYVSGRTDELSALFALLSLLAAGPGTVRALVCAACFFLSLLAKENTLLLPVLAVGWMAVLMPPGNAKSRNIARVAVLQVLAACLYLLARRAVVGSAVPLPSLGGAGERLMTIPAEINMYLGLFFSPYGLHFERHLPVVSGLLELGIDLVILLVWAGLWIGLPVRLIPGGRKSYGLLLLWAAVFFLPVSNVLFSLRPELAGQYLYTAEHFFYLPIAGLAAAGLFLLKNLFAAVSVPAWARRGGVAAAAALCLVPAWQSNRQGRYWSDELFMLQQTVTHTPFRSILRTGLGVVLMERGFYREAIGEFEDALRLDSRQIRVLINIGNAHLKLDNPAAALEQYDRLLSLTPRDAYAQIRRAEALMNLGRLDDAKAQLDAVRPGSPGIAAATLNMRGIVAIREETPSVAAECFSKALETAPGDLTAMGNLALVLIQLGKPDQAAPLLREMIRIDPGNAAPWYNLGRIDAEKGDTSAALASLDMALKINPGLAQARELSDRLRREKSK